MKQWVGAYTYPTIFQGYRSRDFNMLDATRKAVWRYRCLEYRRKEFQIPILLTIEQFTTGERVMR